MAKILKSIKLPSDEQSAKSVEIKDAYHVAIEGEPTYWLDNPDNDPDTPPHKPHQYFRLNGDIAAFSDTGILEIDDEEGGITLTIGYGDIPLKITYCIEEG